MKVDAQKAEQTILKVPWLLLSRLFVFLLLLGIVVFFLKVPDLLFVPFLIYSLLTLVSLAIILLDLKRTYEFLFNFIIALHILFEIVIEAGVIYHTGRVDSPFAVLFILTIISTSLVYHLGGSVIVASLSILSYVFTIIWSQEGFGFSSFSLKNLRYVNDVTFYKVFLYICAFYLVAFIGGYLAQRVKIKGEELWSASVELNRIRTDTDDVLRHVKSGLVTVDALGRIIYFNRAAEEILGYKEQEVKGKNYEDVFKKRMPQLGEKFYQALRFSQVDSRDVLYITGANNRKVPLGISTSILGDKDGEIRGVIAIFQDITGALKLEERIRTADRLAAVGELSAGIAHEIRNPLASISGSVEVLKEELSLSGENQKLLELIIKETGRLNKILTEFLQYAKIGPAVFTKVELTHLVDEVIEIVKKHPALGQGVSVKKEMTSDSLYVLGEENQIKQILLNLLVNAIESMSEGSPAFGGGEEKPGEILVTTQSLNQIDQYYFNGEEPEDSDWVPIAITDLGKGMTEEQKEKIFSPFYSTKKNGTGLGLAIVQRLVNNLGGKIEFRSQLGRGSVFVVYLQKYKKPEVKILQTVQTA
ncbi:MAG: ATP-binding protein [candidate division Zixibacteria bacterium]|nr:ATP-binding protein [candidate division Zixibacteria bacterium]